MTIVHSLRERAIALRRQGRSYAEILKEVSVAKSTLSLWLRSVGLSKQQKQRLTEKKLAAMRKGWARIHENKIARVADIKDSARKEISRFIHDPLWLTGLVLYWGEGAKEKAWGAGTVLKFSNMDIATHRIFIAWASKFGGYVSKDFKYDIYIHETADIEKAKRYWADNLGVPSDIFRVYLKRAVIKTRRKNVGVGYYGVLRTCILKSIDLNRKIAGWTEGVIEYLQ